MSVGRITAPRTLLAKERGEMVSFLRENRPDLDGERIAELLDFTELNGEAMAVRDGVHLFLTAAGWGGDLFAPRGAA